MFKLLFAVRKEGLLLIRDKTGLAILFLMPMFLIILMSLIQEVGWGTLVKESKVPILFVDNDHDSLSMKIRNGLKDSNFFTLIDSLDSAPLTMESAKEAVKNGKYIIGVVIPGGISSSVRANVRIMVAKTLAGFGLLNASLVKDIPFKGVDTVTIFFDPTIKPSFKNAVLSSIRENNYRNETEMVFRTFNREMAKQFPMYTPPEVTYNKGVEFKAVYPGYQVVEKTPNTTQHNVPAWTIFSMFFIVIPLTSSMIKEREEGSLIRLLTLPVSYISLLLAKSAIYLLVCLVQCTLMILAGIYVLPLFGIPTLVIGDQLFPVIMMSFATSLAALGYGLMIGTIFTTHQQAAGFGSVSIIILAAIGGLWVPIYLMPGIMRQVAMYSPLNWAISGFYNIFLRGGTFLHILPEFIKLLTFFLGTIMISYIYRFYKSPIKK
jgi:ABC-2 type transport system permease protein